MIPDSPQGMNLHERIKELKKYFRHANRRPLSRKGQNFLVEQSAFEVILKEGEAGERDVVLEVGTGSGVLTSLLASRAGQVVTVEADPFLYRFSEGFLRTYGNVEHYLADILESKRKMNPRIWERVQTLCKEGRKLRVISNPPYSISTPLIMNLLTSGIPFSRMVLTLQLEIGLKVLALPGTKDYGPISVISRIFSTPRFVKRLSAGCFWPSPKVDSVIVRFDAGEGMKERIEDFSIFEGILRALFSQRRKKASNSLKTLFSNRAGWKRIVEKAGIGGKRGEELAPEEMVLFSNEFSKFSKKCKENSI